MKRITISILIAALAGIVLLPGCGVDVYANKRPPDYNNTKWVSLEPDIWFTVHDRECIGEITIDGITTEIHVDFDYGARVNFSPPRTSENQLDYYKHFLFSGSCKFSESKLVVTIDNNSKGFLDNSIKEITFKRREIEIEFKKDIHSKNP